MVKLDIEVKKKDLVWFDMVGEVMVTNLKVWDKVIQNVSKGQRQGLGEDYGDLNKWEVGYIYNQSGGVRGNYHGVQGKWRDKFVYQFY